MYTASEHTPRGVLLRRCPLNLHLNPLNAFDFHSVHFLNSGIKLSKLILLSPLQMHECCQLSMSKLASLFSFFYLWPLFFNYCGIRGTKFREKVVIFPIFSVSWSSRMLIYLLTPFQLNLRINPEKQALKFSHMPNSITSYAEPSSTPRWE